MKSVILSTLSTACIILWTLIFNLWSLVVINWKGPSHASSTHGSASPLPFFLSLIECLSAGPVSHSIPVKDYQSSFFKVDFGCGGGGCDTL